jgi:photosystem II stability/assembly factor-like uncharacterized protein
MPSATGNPKPSVTPDPVPSATPEPVPSATPPLGRTAYFLTNGAVTFRSEDTGATWREVLPVRAELSFVDSREGWATAGAVLFKTVDGGGSWSDETDHLPLAGAVLGSIHFADRATGILAAAQPDTGGQTVFLLRSSDAGESWSIGFERERCVGDALLCITEGGRALAIACGEVLRSVDGGATWAPVTGLPPVFTSSPPSCSGDSDFWLVHPGSVSRSADGGLSWKEQPVPPGTTGVSFVSDRIGWAVAADDDFGTDVFRTDDGGASWELQLTTPEALEPSPPPAVYFEDARHGMIAEFRLTIFFMGWYGEPRRWLTDDGGASWREIEFSGERGLPSPGEPYLGAIGLP